MSDSDKTRKPGFGILTVTTEALAGALCLPEGYRIIGVDFNHQSRGLDLTLMSDALPEVQEDQCIPHVSLLAHVQYLPDQPPEYCKITAEVKVQ